MARRRGAGLPPPSSSSLTTYRLARFTDRNGPERSSHLPRHYSSISPDPSDEKSGGYTSAPRLRLAPLSTEPFIHDSPDPSDNASSGFNGSSRMMMSAPRPVSTPPTEVAIRHPC